MHRVRIVVISMVLFTFSSYGFAAMTADSWATHPNYGTSGSFVGKDDNTTDNLKAWSTDHVAGSAVIGMSTDIGQSWKFTADSHNGRFFTNTLSVGDVVTVVFDPDAVTVSGRSLYWMIGQASESNLTTSWGVQVETRSTGIFAFDGNGSHSLGAAPATGGMSAKVTLLSGGAYKLDLTRLSDNSVTTLNSALAAPVNYFEAGTISGGTSSLYVSGFTLNVPEPGSIGLVGLVACGLLAKRRR